MGGFQGDLKKLSSDDPYYVLFGQKGGIVAQGRDDSVVMKNLYELSGIKGEDVFKSTAEHPFTIRKDSSSTANETLYVYAPISFDGVTAQWGIGSATNYDVFTAVAEEIRKLAEQSSSFTDDIRGIIHELKTKSQQAVDTMHVSTKLASESHQGLESTKECFDRISETVEETGEVVKKLNTSAKTMGEKHASISDVVQNLSALAEENAATTEEGSASVETQSNALEDIAKASEGLAEIATDLQREVERFKL